MTSAPGRAPIPHPHRLEILAPAGSLEAFAAALGSGADAVYLGLAEGFNARARATDFKRSMLRELAERAHRAGAKLYLTLNTLVFEHELESASELLSEVYEAGVDAIIVQDPAVALLAQALCPTLAVHASTQMTISSPEGARFAAGLGATRVVLPRELSIREIGRFVAGSPLETEVFAHGALCMAWSGQCLTSEALSNRSANRGQCSQACRMPYDLVVDGERRDLGGLRYLLSPQDLQAHDLVPDLQAAGVTSLKIEGRYKNAAYVATAVEALRAARDAAAAGKSDADDPSLQRAAALTQLTFSRGASPGFLRGDNHQALVVGTTPKHRGLPLGHVRAVRGRKVSITPSAPDHVTALLRPGVGVVFEVGNPENDDAPGGPVFTVDCGPQGLTLGFGAVGPELSRLRPGTPVRLTGDPELARAAGRLQTPPEGRIPLQLAVLGKAGAPLTLRACAELGPRRIEAVVHSAQLLTPARGDGLHAKLLHDKLGAFGGTPFRVAQLQSADLLPGLHLAVSELKRLRRELASQLSAQLLPERSVAAVPAPTVGRLRSELAVSASEQNQSPCLVPLCRTAEQLEAVIACGNAIEEVELDFMELVGLRQAVERARACGLRVTLATIRVQKPGEEGYDRRLAALEPDGVLVRHWGGLMTFAAAENSRPLAVHGDFSLNVTNSLTALHLLKLGLHTVTASHDLDRAQLLALIDHIPRGRVALTVHHHIATFHNSHCVYAHLLSQGSDFRSCGRPCEQHRVALRDFSGHEHPVVVDVGCRNTVFNSKAQSAAPLVPQLLERGVWRFRVEFVWESRDEVQRTLTAYQGLLEGEQTPRATMRSIAVHERYGVVALRTRSK